MIPKASRTEVMQASVKKSRLWNHCKVFLLCNNMRLGRGMTDADNKKIADFAKWVLDVGDRKV